MLKICLNTKSLTWFDLCECLEGKTVGRNVLAENIRTKRKRSDNSEGGSVASDSDANGETFDKGR